MLLVHPDKQEASLRQVIADEGQGNPMRRRSGHSPQGSRTPEKNAFAVARNATWFHFAATSSRIRRRKPHGAEALSEGRNPLRRPDSPCAASPGR